MLFGRSDSMKKVIVILGGNKEETMKRFKDGLSLYYQNENSEIINSGIGSFELISDYIRCICEKDEQFSSRMIRDPLPTYTKQNMEDAVVLIGDDAESVAFVGGSRQIAEIKVYARCLREALKGKELEFYGTSEIFNKYMPIHLVESFVSLIYAPLANPGEKIIDFIKKFVYRGREL